MASDMELWWGSGSDPCWSVLIVLEEKGIRGFKSHLIDFSTKEHKGGENLRLNPRGEVPTFRDGTTVICESQAICDYLEAKYPDRGARLLPADVTALGQVLQRKYELMNLKKKFYEEYFYPKMRAQKEDPEMVAKRKAGAVNELNLLEGYLDKNTYLGGEDFSMADVILYPRLAFFVRMGLPVQKLYPKLFAYYTKLTERPSIQATWPPHWKTGAGGTALADF